MTQPPLYNSQMISYSPTLTNLISSARTFLRLENKVQNGLKNINKNTLTANNKSSPIPVIRDVNQTAIPNPSASSGKDIKFS